MEGRSSSGRKAAAANKLQSRRLAEQQTLKTLLSQCFHSDCSSSEREGGGGVKTCKFARINK